MVHTLFQMFLIIFAREILKMIFIQSKIRIREFRHAVFIVRTLEGKVTNIKIHCIEKVVNHGNFLTAQ